MDGPARAAAVGEGEASFFLEFRGCLYDHLPGTFRRKLGQLVHIQPRVLVRPHVAQRRLEVPEDERPAAPERRAGASAGIVGTASRSSDRTRPPKRPARPGRPPLQVQAAARPRSPPPHQTSSLGTRYSWL
ncbi:MAG: hypothetical protein R3F43_29170 [bacterium]